MWAAPIALVKEGDSITIDADKRLIQLNVPAKELAARRKKWKQPKPRYTRGLLAKYTRAGFDREQGRGHRLSPGAAAAPHLFPIAG